MKSVAKRAAIAPVFLLALSAGAGPLTEATMVGQALQYTKAGQIDGCGVRIVGLAPSSSAKMPASVFDVSFNVANPGGGMVKGGLMTMPTASIQAGRPDGGKKVPISMLWLRAPGSTATTPNAGKVLQASGQEHVLMYGTDLSPVLALVAAMHDRQPIQVGFSVIQNDMDEVFFGRIEMKEGDSQQFAQCFSEWSDAILKRTGDQVPR